MKIFELILLFILAVGSGIGFFETDGDGAGGYLASGIIVLILLGILILK